MPSGTLVTHELQLIKAFLLEAKQRHVHMWPESLRSCMCALVAENRQLVQATSPPFHA